MLLRADNNIPSEDITLAAVAWRPVSDARTRPRQVAMTYAAQ